MTNRREFMISSAALAATAALPISFIKLCAATAKTPLSMLNAMAPIQAAATSASTEFNGDAPDHAHEILWDVAGYLRAHGGIPPVSEKHDVVIIGGGLAGLTSAYRLRDLKPLVLEQDGFFGGNAKGEKRGSSVYPMGSAYVSKPEPTSDLGKLLTELGLMTKGYVEGGDDATVYYKGSFAHGFWSGVTDPAAKADFERIHADLVKIYDEGALTVPPSKDAPEGREMDDVPFEKWMTQRWGQVHPHVKEYFQLYCWSSFLASIDEISTSQMLSFVAAETGEIMHFPGGNAAISQALFEKLSEGDGLSRLRNGCIVADIRCVPEGVQICYEGADRVLRTVLAKQVIFAAPKFVAARACAADMPAAQAKAIADIPYRGYVVANVILKKPLKAPSMELYCLKGTPPPSPTAAHPQDRGFTDLVFATAMQAPNVNGVLTAYSGLPYDGARQFLFNPGAHDKYKAAVLKELQPLMQTLGLTNADIDGVRLTRWGHALPIARAGLVKSGTLERASRPIQGKIHFANQDNWANPCFETSLGAGREACEYVRAALKHA